MDGPKKLIALDFPFCIEELAMQGLGKSISFTSLPKEIARPKLFGVLRYELAGPELRPSAFLETHDIRKELTMFLIGPNLRCPGTTRFSLLRAKGWNVPMSTNGFEEFEPFIVIVRDLGAKEFADYFDTTTFFLRDGIHNLDI